MPERKAFAEDYIQVNERILAFYAKYPEGSIQNEIIAMDDKEVVVRSYAYRSAEDPRPGIGHSSLRIPGATPYTRGSELENAETSAAGRALAMLGFEVRRSVASRDEVDAKAGESEGIENLGDGGLIGTAITHGNQDFELRPSPEGHVLRFRLKDGRGPGVIVQADGDPLATAVKNLQSEILDKRVTVWGHFTDEAFTNRDKKRIEYRVFHLASIAGEDWRLPAEEPVDDLSDLPAEWIAAAEPVA